MALPLGVTSITINQCGDTSKTDPGLCTVHLVPTPIKVDPRVQGITDGLAWITLVIALCVVFISCIMWSLGSRADNQDSQFNARRGALAGAFAAIFIGATSSLIHFWISVGTR